MTVQSLIQFVCFSLSGDILVGDYRDSYDNLAFKSVSMLIHFSLMYPHPEYLLKTDDDVFVNVPKLIEFLRTERPSGNSFYFHY